MDATTLARVKEFIPIPTSNTDQDSLLTRLITEVSAEMEAWMDRYLLSTQRTEYFDVADGQQVFQLKGYPVSAVAGVFNDTDWGFSSTDEVPSTNYTFLGTDGLLHFDLQLLIPGHRTLKVTYTGGLAATPAALVSAFPDLALAADEQVAYLYQRRKLGSLGAGSSSVEGGSVSYTPEFNWLKNVERVMRRYRRYSVS